MDEIAKWTRQRNSRWIPGQLDIRSLVRQRASSVAPAADPMITLPSLVSDVSGYTFRNPHNSLGMHSPEHPHKSPVLRPGAKLKP